MQLAPHSWRARCLCLHFAGATARAPAINNHSSSAAGSCRKFCARPFFILSQVERDSARSAEKETLTFAINSSFAVSAVLSHGLGKALC